MPAHAPSVVFVGGGPRTAGMLERLAANRPELFRGGPGHPCRGAPRARLRPDLALRPAPGPDAELGGRGRHHVHRLLGACEGPAADGPGLAEWAAGVLDGSITDVPDFPAALREQLRTLTGATFPTRQLQSQYLEWFFRRAVAQLGGDVTRHRPPRTPPSPSTRRARRDGPHRTRTATAHGAGHTVRLANGGDAARRRRGHRAGPHGLAARCRVRRLVRLRRPARRVPCATQLHHRRRLFPDRARPGRDRRRHGPGVRGPAGPADGGRGGRFEETPGGGLRYLPSGAEPRLWAGSRRGVPYHSKISSALRGEAAGAPRFFTADAVDALLAQPRRTGFPQPPLAAHRQGRRVRLLPGAVHRQPGAGQHGLGGVFRAFRRAGLVQPAHGGSWWPRPSRTRRCTWTSSALDRPFAGGSSPAPTTSRRQWPRYIETDLRLRDQPGPSRNAGPVHGAAQGLHGAGPAGPGRSG